ncbi:MAG: sigma-70 family RNA polymerase sigma factor [Oscillospiraceae bacterium]|nr:sigma-70 family RNA polymerase sigma factor [Oscillospiraceae bacterium]
MEIAKNKENLLENRELTQTFTFDEIYETTYNELKMFVMRKCSNIADVGDVLQETYMEIHQIIQRKGENYIKDPRAICYRICKQKLSKYYHFSAKLKNMLDYSGGGEIEKEMDLYCLEDVVSDNDSIEIAKKHLAKKSPNIQKCFYLFYIEEQSIADIAEILSLTQSDIKNKLYRTIKELRNIL